MLTTRALARPPIYRPLRIALHQIEAFVIVCETGMVTRAAERLRIVQPALSRKMRVLEQALGAKLLVHAHNQLYLTPAGEVFLPQAREILRACREAERNVRQYGRMLEGPRRSARRPCARPSDGFRMA